MISPSTGKGRGFAFVVFYTEAEALHAVDQVSTSCPPQTFLIPVTNMLQLNGRELYADKFLLAKISEPRARLFLGSIPKRKTKEELERDLGAITRGAFCLGE